MREGGKNAVLSHEVMSGMEVRMIDCIMKKTLFQFLNNAFSDQVSLLPISL